MRGKFQSTAKSALLLVARKVAPWAGYLFYRALWLTWRIEIFESPEFKNQIAANMPIVYAHWHGDELGILFLLKPYRACAMISTSDDGAIMNRVVQLMGAATSRGSSTRGGISALRGILRLAKEGWRPSVAVDGPKGPRFKIKPGVFEIAKLTGATVFPLTVACSRAWVFEKSWNKAYLPKPFARVAIVFGPPALSLKRDDIAHDIHHVQLLEAALINAGRHAQGIIAGA